MYGDPYMRQLSITVPEDNEGNEFYESLKGEPNISAYIRKACIHFRRCENKISTDTLKGVIKNTTRSPEQILDDERGAIRDKVGSVIDKLEPKKE